MRHLSESEWRHWATPAQPAMSFTESIEIAPPAQRNSPTGVIHRPHTAVEDHRDGSFSMEFKLLHHREKDSR
jgi:hypothetical protein